MASLLTPGFQSFVAWRYLLTRPRRVSRLAVWIFCIAMIVAVGSSLAARFLLPAPDPRSLLPADPSPWLPYLLGTTVGGFVIAFLALFFGALRLIFTFFTTVPIGGVWIGTAALVCVLSVMGGFESDLRVKILGSNAHMQVTKTGSPFVEWEDVKARIDRVPGVVASMPFATTEGVLAANSNYATVIVKGIDPASLGLVTRLGRDLEDPESLRRMAPLVDDEVPETAIPDRAPADPDARDPAPVDMPGSADPIDFSGGDDGAEKPDAKGDRKDDAKDDTKDAKAPTDGPPGATGGAAPAAVDDRDDAVPPGFGGDARAMLDRAGAVVDPAPDDLTMPEELEPGDVAAAGPDKGEDKDDDTNGDANGSDDDDPAAGLGDEALDAGVGPGAGIETRVIRIGPDGIASRRGRLGPSDTAMSRRTASLPGILVGRELVKQIHLYIGQEVRVVSPLSDPANPDATGTPIPYNRDYRVAGVFFTGMYEYDLKFVYVPLESLQDFLDLGDGIDGVEIRILDPEATDEVAARIGAALGPGYVVKDWKELNRNLFSALKLEKIAMFLILAIIILVASFAIIGNLIMVVMEKSKEIALLKTLGASNSGIMMLFVTQGFFIGVVGTSLGVAFGLFACWLGKTYGLPLNPDVYYIDKLPIHVDASAVAAVGAAGVMISVAATLYPALVAARLQPAAGLRHE